MVAVTVMDCEVALRAVHISAAPCRAFWRRTSAHVSPPPESVQVGVPGVGSPSEVMNANREALAGQVKLAVVRVPEPLLSAGAEASRARGTGYTSEMVAVTVN
jgi:hypothetical protein